MKIKELLEQIDWHKEFNDLDRYFGGGHMAEKNARAIIKAVNGGMNPKNVSEEKIKNAKRYIQLANKIRKEATK